MSNATRYLRRVKPRTVDEGGELCGSRPTAGWRSGVLVLSLALLGGCGGSASSRGQGKPAGDQEVAGATGDAGADADTSTSGASATGGSGSGGSAGMAPGGGRPPTAGTAGDATGTPGGAPSGGTGGTGGAAQTLPLPVGCEARARTESATSCTLAAYCKVHSQITGCQQLPSGNWQCRCESAPERFFEVADAPGLQACAVAAGVCDVKESQLGEETCVTRTDDSAKDTCRFSRTCRREIPLDFAPNAHAWFVRDGWASCDRRNTGPTFGCQCSTGAATVDYDMWANTGESACQPLYDFCMSGAKPQYGTEDRCALASATSDAEACNRQEDCALVMPLGNDVYLAKLTPHDANCVKGAASGADCYCSTENASTLNLHLTATPADATCNSAIAVCSKGAVITPTSNASCDLTSLTVFGQTSCEADFSCQQSATVGGQAMVMEGRLLDSCARNAPTDPWDCSCASDQLTTSFRLGAASAKASEACQQASAGCLERLQVHLGPYGEVVIPPYPLSP